MLSKSERDAIRAREQAATKGPWEFRDGHSADGDLIELLMAEVGRAGPDEEPEYSQVLFHGDFSDSEIQENWAFVGHARADIPALLDELDAKDRLLAEREVTIAAMRKALELAIECIDLDSPGVEYTVEHDLRPVLQSPDPGKALLAEHAAELERLRQQCADEVADLKVGKALGLLDKDALRQRAEAAERKVVKEGKS